MAETGKRLALVPTQSLADAIRRELEHLILGGAFRSGERLNEKVLAERWGVSRAPVREACRGLQKAGLVEIINNRGVLVRKVGFEEAIMLFDIRSVLARLGARLATQNMTPADAARLEALIRKMDEIAGRRDPDAYLPLNLAFHEQIFAIAGNRRLAELDRDLGNELRLMRRRGLTPRSLTTSNAEHKRLLELFVAGDADRAVALFEAHILAGRDRFLVAVSADANVSKPDPAARRDKGRGRPGQAMTGSGRDRT